MSFAEDCPRLGGKKSFGQPCVWCAGKQCLAGSLLNVLLKAYIYITFRMCQKRKSFFSWREVKDSNRWRIFMKKLGLILCEFRPMLRPTPLWHQFVLHGLCCQTFFRPGFQLLHAQAWHWPPYHLYPSHEWAMFYFACFESGVLFLPCLCTITSSRFHFVQVTVQLQESWRVCWVLLQHVVAGSKQVETFEGGWRGVRVGNCSEFKCNENPDLVEPSNEGETASKLWQQSVPATVKHLRSNGKTCLDMWLML